MKPSLLAVLALVGAGLCLPVSRAAELGDPAAPLKIAEWIKGDAVDLAKVKNKKIVVVEFWATWCPPCRTSIPHLTEIQRKFKDKDVVVVGVSSETVADIKPFTTRLGDTMDYVVAADDDEATSKGYMTAYGQNGIPHAFIVDKQGRVVWHGHPMAGLDTALEELVAGKFDLEKARQRGAAEARLQEYRRLLAAGGDETKIVALEKELVALDSKLGGLTPGQKFDPAAERKRLGFNRAIQEYQQAFAEDPASARVRELEKQLQDSAPAGFDFADFKRELGAQVAFVAYMEEALGGADTNKLAGLARRLETAAGTNAPVLNQIAWTLLTDENLKQRDLVLATKLAKAAFDASAGKDASIADTYARALFDNGKVAEAVELQKKAVALCDDADMRESLEANLKTYEAKLAKP